MEDQAEEDLPSVRASIKRLQNERLGLAKELEELEKEKSRLKSENKEQEDRISEKQGELRKEETRAAKGAENPQDLEERERSSYISGKVREQLTRRIPGLRLPTVDEERGNHDDDEVSSRKEKGSQADGVQPDSAQAEGKDKQPPGKKKKDIHTNVLVSYVNPGSDDYQVCYRIDKSLTVWQLHRDCCSYWGCSQNEYVLCRTNEKDEVEKLWTSLGGPDLEQKVQSDVVLQPTEKAQLHLVKLTDFEEFLKIQDKAKELKAKQQKEGEAAAEDPNTIKTLKYGYVMNEPVAEPFVDALKHWPGVHTLLKNRDRTRVHKWAKTSLRDFVAFGLLIILTCISIGMRSSLPLYLLRHGVVETLSVGINGQTSNYLPPVDFETIDHTDEMWDWIQGTLHYQIWNKDSTLRRFYQPVGYLQLRQQIAGDVECAARNIPVEYRKPCYTILVDAATQYTANLSPQSGEKLVAFTRFNATTVMVRSVTPPNSWRPPSNPDYALRGIVQNAYDSSGYAINYDTRRDITDDQWTADMSFARDLYITPRTRMVAVEVTLANVNLGGFVSANFLFEITPGGSIHTVLDVMPFNPYTSVDIEVAEAVDYIRLVVVGVYLLIIRVYCKLKERHRQNRSRLGYFSSFGGCVDFSIIGFTIACAVESLQADPPDPLKLEGFYSYATVAQRQETLSVLEAVLLMLLIVRFTTLMRISPVVYRVFKHFKRSVHMFVHFMVLFLPIIFGIIFLANTIWAPYIISFSTWSQTTSIVVLGTYQPVPDIIPMQATGGTWTIPFVVFFWLSTAGFAIHMFLAITVQACFEVDLVEGSDAKQEKWTREKYLHWALWNWVYKLVGNDQGSSKSGKEEGEGDGDSSSSSSDSDNDGQ